MQLRQGEIEAYREQQEDHAEFSERLEFRHVDGRPDRVRPEYHADQQISQTGRHAQALKYEHDGHCHGQEQDDLREIFHVAQGLSSTSQPAAHGTGRSG